MQRFLVKRYFIIIAACFLLLGALIPIASHAVSSAHAASVTQQGEPLTAVLTKVGITNRCSFEGGQVIATLNKGQEIDVTAVAKTTALDPDPGTTDQEDLSIYEVGLSPFRIIVVNSGSHSFEFKANQNGVTIAACWALLRTDDDGDYSTAATFLAWHSATVKYEVETGS
jgi:hypothetical protein